MAGGHSPLARCGKVALQPLGEDLSVTFLSLPTPLHTAEMCVWWWGGGAVSRYRSLYVCVCVSVCPSSAQTPVGTAKDSGLAFFSPVSLGPSTKPST